ncbi:hypothetical protein LINPERHAP1_LOCUS13127 [Linum perenne]
MNEDSDTNPRCPRILFTDDEIKSFYRPWSKALVVKVLERTFSFAAVKRRLENLWARNGNIQVSDASNSFFLVRFADPSDYQRAGFQGPWKVAVTRIGNNIGKTVRLDLATTEGARGRYDRVCVEIDISKPLLGKYMIDDHTYLVDYESLENICFACWFYGHKIDSCQVNHQHVPKPTLPEAEVHVQSSTPTGEAGEWTTVQR